MSSTHREPSIRRRAGRGVRGGVVFLLSLFAGRAVAQQVAADLPTLEPRLTRIIGSDSLQIGQASLSPDGRWVAYQASSPDGSGLWVISVNGGTPTRLVETRNVGDPAWFPGGDRIAYSQGGEPDDVAIMVVPFDGVAGRASGPPRRVTIDRTHRGFRLSPDGRWIAYTAGGVGNMSIRVIPSNGGTARTITEPCLRLFVQDWSTDGRFVYFLATWADRPNDRAIMRVAVDGGAAQRVEERPTGPTTPASRYRVAAAPDATTAGLPYVAQTYNGETFARIALPEHGRPMAWVPAFSHDGRYMLTVAANSALPLRVLPVAGGVPRQLGEARGSETPLGWSPDGAEVLYGTTLDGRRAIMSVPVTGGAAREIGSAPDRGPAGNPWANSIDFSADGRYLAYSRPTPGSQDRTLVVRPVAGGEERVITRSLFFHQSFRLAGPGGTPNTAGNDFLYLERKGEQVELRATSVDGPSRLLRAFPASEARRRPKGVFGEWVAWGIEDDGSAGRSRIVAAKGPDGTPKELAVIDGGSGFDDVVWSADGRWIAATTYVGRGDEGEMKILVVGVTPDGDVSVPARLIEPPIVPAAWGLRWLPDNSAVTVYAQSVPDWTFHLWLVPLQNGARPVQLSRDEKDNILTNILSPDGKYIAYQVNVQRGSSLWLADFGDALSRRD